jgi:cellulose synthase/poly-beta-1,6-N-acetylglucosamine synthase-like glycosyltransferase
MGKRASLKDGLRYAKDNKYDVIVEIGADAIPVSGAIERLLAPLEDEGVGASCARQIPLGTSLTYRIDRVVWSLLAIAKRIQSGVYGTCYLGGVMYAFKTRLVDFAGSFVNDDEELGTQIAKAGKRVVFVQDALVYFDASADIRHMLERRKRMLFGHYQAAGTMAPSMDRRILMRAITDLFRESPGQIFFFVPAALVELVSRVVARAEIRSQPSGVKYVHWYIPREKAATHSLYGSPHSAPGACFSEDDTRALVDAST